MPTVSKIQKSFFLRVIKIAFVTVLIISLFVFQSKVFAIAFNSPTTVPTGAGARGVVIADFNGDGKMDIAQTNFTDNTVGIFLGDGTGGFTAQPTLSTGSGPISISVGDFNGDGKKDLAVSNNVAGTVSIFLGDGTGGFTSHAIFSLPGSSPSPNIIAVADFNGDGKQDLAVTDYTNGQTDIFLGDGTGGFTPASTPTISTGTGTRGLTIGDFNNDGKQDFAVANDAVAGTVAVVLGNGDGTFGTPTVYTVGREPWSITAGDFRHSGKLDLAVGNYSDGTISILLNDGSGNFTPATPATISLGIVNGVQSIASADLDGDGKVDLIATKMNNNLISVLMSNGDGTFQSPINLDPTSNQPYGLATGDLNGDSLPDIVVTNLSGSNMDILLQQQPVGPLDHFTFNPISSPVAGSPFNITITAKDSSNNTVTSFNGSVDLTTNSGTIQPSTSTTFVSGIATTSVIISNSGSHYITATDHAGSGKVGTSTSFSVVDPVTVTNVTSSKPDGSYKAGVHIPIDVVFSATVNVTGTPIINIVSNSPTSTAVNYATGTGSNTLEFDYLVGASDTSADLAYEATSSLQLSGATIKDIYGNDAQLTLPIPGATSSLSFNKNIVIDTTPPVISEISPIASTTVTKNPSYTFSSNETGTNVFGGSCGGSPTTTTLATNTVSLGVLGTLGPLPDGTYSDCTILVQDAAGNNSNTLNIPSFTVYTPVAVTETHHSGGFAGGGGSGGGGSTGTIGNGSSKTSDGGSITNTNNDNTTVTTVTTDTKTDTTVTDTNTTDNTTKQTDTTNVTDNNKTETTQSNTQTQSTSDNTGATAVGSSATQSSGGQVSVSGGGVSGIPQTQSVLGSSFGIDCSNILNSSSSDPLGFIARTAKESYCQTGVSIQTTSKKVAEILSTPKVNVVEKTVATTGVVVGTTVTVTTALFLNPLSFSELFLIPIRLWSLLMTTLGLKKRRRPWGTVYDSVTKQPLDPAYVTLRSSDGKDIASTITDLDGRFGFLIPEPGNYSILAQKSNYLFPSQHLVGHDHDELYRDLYFGEHFTVTTGGEIITRNIPMDAENFDWNEFAKKDQKLMKFYSNKNKLIFLFSDIFFGLGFVVSSIAVLAAPKGYNVAIFILYAIVYFIRKHGLKARAFGYLSDKKTGKPISFGIIRISQKETGVEIMHRITDKTGKYYCLLPNGEYIVRIDRKLPNGEYETIAQNIPASVTKGYLSENFEL